MEWLHSIDCDLTKDQGLTFYVRECACVCVSYHKGTKESQGVSCLFPVQMPRDSCPRRSLPPPVPKHTADSGQDDCLSAQSVGNARAQELETGKTSKRLKGVCVCVCGLVCVKKGFKENLYSSLETLCP